MARRNAVARQLRACRRDVDVTLAVELGAVVVPGREETEVLELAGERRGHTGTLAELGQVDIVLGVRDPGARPVASLGALRRARRGQLLANHPQGEKLVALQPQNRLETLDVLFAEEPVATLRPARREQALILQITDLRDRDVGELLLQAPRNRADRQQPLCRGGLGRGAHLLMKLNLYLPICTSSPLCNFAAASIRLRLTKVP